MTMSVEQSEGAARSMLADLRSAEAARPEHPLLRWREGEWSVAEFSSAVRRAAAAMGSRGVGQGQRVALMAGNSAEHLAAWYGCQLAGGVVVPINPEHKGEMLRHLLVDSKPTCVIAEQSCRAALAELDLRDLPVIALDDELLAAQRPAIAELDPDPDQLAVISYTSGTTGPSKGVMLPFGYYASHGRTYARLGSYGADDVFYFPLPFFHIDAHVWLASCLVSGMVLAFPPRFSATAFWDDCVRFGATMTALVGFGLDVLAARPAPPTEVSARLRAMYGAPVSEEAFAFFEDKLGIPLYQLYGQTEVGAVTFSSERRNRRGATGWPSNGFDVVIQDRAGGLLPPGEVGEICCRPMGSNLMSLGYWGRPEATVAASKDLWWHTGDLGHQDEDGFVWFVGRERDSLRRRGENISAFELEAALREAEGVRDCAAVGVKDPVGGEDEVKVFLILHDGEGIDPGAFFEFCERNLPAYAVPRFVELLAEEDVVRSPGTGVVQKHLLPSANTEATIDRQASST